MKPQYPLDSNAYRILSKIGAGASATVYKAICLPMNSTIVAIKTIDLDQSRSDFDSFQRETKTMSLLSHPNILNAHCSFTVGRRLWVVMPFMSCGSLQSIVSSAFPHGLPENCISVFLKETLNAISYLHDQGHLHRDIKAGNILVDSNGSIKLADFGVSASIYEPVTPSSGMTSSSLRLTDVAGTPYWMAPEVVHSHTGYGFKADIWSFGITALELAHGRPPLSHLPLLKSLLIKITKRFRFSDYENSSDGSNKNDNKKFSKAFKNMVKSCLDQDPARRPSAEKLSRHSFFKNCKGIDFLVKNVLNGLPSVEARFQNSSIVVKNNQEDDEDGEEMVKHRRVSGWNFNEDELELSPVFPTESDDFLIKKKVGNSKTTEIDDLAESNMGPPEMERQRNTDAEGAGSGEGSGNSEIGECNLYGLDRGLVLEKLMILKMSLDDQRAKVSNLIAELGGEVTSREDQLVLMVEKLRNELEAERLKKRLLVQKATEIDC